MTTIEAKELLPCHRGSCGAEARGTDNHYATCPAYYRSAVNEVLGALQGENELLKATVKSALRAVNNRSALIVALKTLMPEGWDDGTMDHMPGIKQAREALAATRPNQG